MMMMMIPNEITRARVTHAHRRRLVLLPLAPLLVPLVLSPATLLFPPLLLCPLCSQSSPFLSFSQSTTTTRDHSISSKKVDDDQSTSNEISSEQLVG